MNRTKDEMDEIARNYVAMGITEEEDIGTCLHCEASVMPWQLLCEGCGSGSPFTPTPAPLWMCNLCGMDDYESEQDAEECCLVDESDEG